MPYGVKRKSAAERSGRGTPKTANPNKFRNTTPTAAQRGQATAKARQNASKQAAQAKTMTGRAGATARFKAGVAGAKAKARK